MSVFAKRMKELRKLAGLSQEKLGVLAGIDEMTASARMNQYERGKYSPDGSTVERIAKVLNAPEGYFYTADDETASLFLTLHRMDDDSRKKVIEFARMLAV